MCSVTNSWEEAKHILAPNFVNYQKTIHGVIASCVIFSHSTRPSSMASSTCGWWLRTNPIVPASIFKAFACWRSRGATPLSCLAAPTRAPTCRAFYLPADVYLYNWVEIPITFHLVVTVSSRLAWLLWLSMRIKNRLRRDPCERSGASSRTKDRTGLPAV